jgi:hypothetical protein
MIAYISENYFSNLRNILSSIVKIFPLTLVHYQKTLRISSTEAGSFPAWMIHLLHDFLILSGSQWHGRYEIGYNKILKIKVLTYSSSNETVYAQILN